MEPINANETTNSLRRSESSDSSSFDPPSLGHEVLKTPSSRPCSWLHENSYVFNTLPSSLRSSSGASSSTSSSASSLSSPGLKYDMTDPWAPVPDGVEMTQEEVQRRYNLLSPTEICYLETVAERGEELRQTLSNTEEVVSTTGEKMHVKELRDPKLFRNWSWNSTSSRQRKKVTATGETAAAETAAAANNEDGDEEDEEDAYHTSFSEQRDSIEVQREWRGRKSPTEEYYRWGEGPSPRSTIAHGFRRVRKFISAVHSRRTSPMSRSHNNSSTSGVSNSSSDSSDDDDNDADEPSPSPSPTTSPQRTKSKLKMLVSRFARSQQRQQQQQETPKHKPCHRSRPPNAPLLKNGDEPIPVLPPWSDRIGPKDETLEDLWKSSCGLAAAAAAASANGQSIEPAHWLSGRCC